MYSTQRLGARQYTTLTWWRCGTNTQNNTVKEVTTLWQCRKGVWWLLFNNQLVRYSISPMDPIREKMWKWIRCRLSDFHVVKVLAVIPHLSCLTDSDVEQIRCHVDRHGNNRGMDSLLDHLWRRSRWYNYFIEALRKEGHSELADTVQAELSTHQVAKQGVQFQTQLSSARQPVMQQAGVPAMQVTEPKPKFPVQASSDPPTTTPVHLPVQNQATLSAAAETAKESLTTAIVSGGGAATVESPKDEDTGASSQGGSSADVSSDGFLDGKDARAPVQETNDARAPVLQAARGVEEIKLAACKPTSERLRYNAEPNVPKQRPRPSRVSQDARRVEDDEDNGKPQVLMENPSDMFNVRSDDLQISVADTLQASAVSHSSPSENEDSLPWETQGNGDGDSDAEEDNDEEHEEVNRNEDRRGDTAEVKKKPGENIDDKIRALEGYRNPDLFNNAIDIHSPLLLQMQYDKKRDCAGGPAVQTGISTAVPVRDLTTDVGSSPQLRQLAASGSAADNYPPRARHAGVPAKRPEEASDEPSDEQTYVQRYAQPGEKLDAQPNEPGSPPQAVTAAAQAAEPLPDRNGRRERRLLLGGAVLVGLMAVVWFAVRRR